MDLLGNVSSIYSYCSELNQSFIRYKNHAKYLNDLALQLDSIYKLSENQALLKEKEKEYNKYSKDKSLKDNLINPYNNYKNELESSIPPVIFHFYNYTKKFIKHVKKIKAKNFVERLWYLSVNDEKMDMLESELDFIMKQFQIDTFSLLHGYVKSQKDIGNVNKEVLSLPQSVTNINEQEDNNNNTSIKQKDEDKLKRKEKEMKRKTKEMQKREYELIKELEKLRRKNEIERKKRRELEKIEEYKYYKDILENDEKLYKKMLVRVPITTSSSSSNNNNNNNNNNSNNSNNSNNKLMASSKSQNSKDTFESKYQ